MTDVEGRRSRRRKKPGTGEYIKLPWLVKNCDSGVTSRKKSEGFSSCW